MTDLRSIARRVMSEEGFAPELPAELLRPHAPADEGERLASLSAREFEVFRLLAQGHTASECAQRLNLSAKTVSNHQSAIKEKLGVRSVAEIVSYAHRAGLVD